MWKNLFSYDYQGKWKAVENESLENPKTALSKIEEIRKQAIKEKNRLQELRCILSENNVLGNIDDEAFSKTLKNLKDFKNNEKDPSILSLAKYYESIAYETYYESNRWKINRRTNLDGLVPEDIEEWTSNIFIDTIRSLRISAVAEPTLKTALPEKYEPLLDLTKENYSRSIRPTLYDVLVHYTIDHSVCAGVTIFSDEEKLQMLQELVDFHKNDNNRSSYVMARLDYLQKKMEKDECQVGNHFNKKYYVDELYSFLEEMKEDSSSTYIRVQLARILLESLPSSESSRKIDISTEEDMDDSFQSTTEQVVSVCKEGWTKYPKHSAVKFLKNIYNDMKLSSFNVSLEGIVHEGDSVKFNINYANQTDIKLSIYRFNATALEWFDSRKLRDKLKRTHVADYSFKLEATDYCIKKDTVVEIPSLPLGAYRVSVGENSFDFAVTNFQVLYSSSSSENLKSHFVVVDSKTGAPIENVKMDVYTKKGWNSEWELAQSDKTSDQGLVSVDVDKRITRMFAFSKGADIYTSLSTSFYKQQPTDNEAFSIASIFTDRSIYRPGQTVHYKCILHDRSEKGTFVLSNHEVRMTLLDANYQVVGEQVLQTNEFGSVASSFVLPANGLPGSYLLSANGSSSISIRVEEYKRPTFEVKLNRPKEIVSFGDTVVLKGSADYLLGTPVSNAKVSYKITSGNDPFFWWWNSGVPDKIVANGEVKIDEDGTFSFSFVPEKENKRKAVSCVRYSINVSVTDGSGETRQDEMFITVGDESMAILTDGLDGNLLMDELLEKNISVINLNHQPVQTEVVYIISKDDKVVATNKVMSDEKNGFSIQENTKDWESGKYKIEFTAVDTKGSKVTKVVTPVLYRKTDKRPPVEVALWQESLGNFSIKKDEKKTVRIGSSLQDAHLLIITYYNSKLGKCQWVDLNNEIKDFEFSLSDASGVDYESACVKFYLVHNGRVESAELKLNIKKEPKDIPMQLSVFRDKMEPGSKEKWTVTLPVDKAAEVMAEMYDASLDQIYGHSWYLSSVYRKSYPCPYWNSVRMPGGSLYFSQIYSSEYIPSFVFDQLRGDFYYVSYSRGFGAPMMLESCAAGGAKMRKSAVNYMMMADDAVEEESEVVSSYGAPVKDSEEANVSNGKQEPIHQEEFSNQPKVRSNFAETAFFYPQLTPDGKGSVKIEFTMPESLTRWKFMALAHSKDMFVGRLVQEVVTQKNFMITPNLPRFLRNGDICTFSAKVINLSSTQQKGTAKIQFLDPLSEEVKMEQSVDFSLDGEKTETVSWTLEIPHDVEAYLVRTSAVSNDFSDAEQKLLPVLSDRVVLTQSLPLVVRGGKEKSYRFDNLVDNKSKTLSSKFLKLEMATNPIWYAVQSLPSIATVTYESAINYSVAYFSSQMAHKIAQSNPRIFKVIERWKQESADKQTLLSNLEKNQEVKNVLLNETPWVLDAKNETERKQRLATLFDLNDLQGKSDLWISKLNDLQNEDGGFAWFKDMLSGRHTTLFVLDNFGRLSTAGVDLAFEQSRIERAIQFLDQQLKEDLERGRQYDKDYDKHASISSIQLYYYQVRSYYPNIKVASSCKEAYDFYYGLIKKQWNRMGLYSKALAAIALYKGNDTKDAELIVKSLREYSSTSEEMGMYWKTNVSGYLWEDAAISTHTRIMEALALIDPNVEEQNELRIWLLNQKRTQNWDNEIANIDALNVLLLNGSDWLSNDNEVTVSMADKEVHPEETEVGTGYYSVVIPGKEVTPQMGNLSLKSEEGGNISWGAVYWQFEEDMDMVKSSKTGLYIEKMVMREVVKGSQKVLEPITSKTKLNVGDKLIVRLTLRTDRDFDYVSLKDQRASCLEPVQQLSGYRCSEYTCYYQSAKDAAMYYFFDHLHKGTYVFEYPLWVSNAGDFSNGITTVQCLYAPEFSSNTGSVRIKVEK